MKPEEEKDGDGLRLFAVVYDGWDFGSALQTMANHG